MTVRPAGLVPVERMIADSLPQSKELLAPELVRNSARAVLEGDDVVFHMIEVLRTSIIRK